MASPRAASRPVLGVLPADRASGSAIGPDLLSDFRVYQSPGLVDLRLAGPGDGDGSAVAQFAAVHPV